MIALPILAHHLRAARLRVMLDTIAVGLPVLLATCAFAWRLSGVASLAVAAVLTSAVLALVGTRRIARFDRDWLVGELDARVADFEDSSALLLRDSSPRMGGLAALQRARLESRIAEAKAVDLRPDWSRRLIILAWTLSVVLTLAGLNWPLATRPVAPGGAGRPNASSAGPPRVAGTRLRIVPPAYTGLPAREQTGLDVRAPAGSRIEWTIGFGSQPAAAKLAFLDHGSVRLARDGSRWAGARPLDRSMLYRIEATGLARQRLHRLEAVADAAPIIRTVQPESQLVLVTPGQTRWTPVFEASDDYGVAGRATLRITVTKGDGENVTYQQRMMALAGRGEARRKLFSATLDLAREGLGPGGDLIVQLVVSDNRAPARQEVEGPSVILRWPAELALADGLDGMMAKVMPAYFRSQRQIIIDAEALVAQRRRTPPDAFLDRSNGLGNDQAQLRLRYGQFMGEEAEGGGGIALPTNDAPAGPTPPTSDAPAAPPEPTQHTDDDGHDHAAETGPAGPGSAVDPVREFGHAHDTGDAATLFDPGTRSTLSLALDAMWSSERALRQGRPDEALPHAYRALEYLKEAQQASRIFLRRVGSNLPPIDLSRRMSGEREGIVAAPLTAAADPSRDSVMAEAWRALEERPGTRAPLRLDRLERWVRGDGGRLADPLALLAAIDAVRADPNCLSCRSRLRASIWSALERPPAAVRRRNAPDARGRRYLDALR